MLLDLKDLELVFVDPWTNPAELEQYNPFSQIPVLLTDEGTAISHSLLICQYLADTRPDAQELAVTAYAASLLENTIQAFKLVRFKAEGSENHPLTERCLNAIRHALGQAPELQPQSKDWPQVMLGTTLLTLKLRNPDLFEQHARADTKTAVTRFAERDDVRKTAPEALAAKPASIGAL